MRNPERFSGLSVIFHDNHVQKINYTRARTPYYISPEILDGKYDESGIPPLVSECCKDLIAK